VAILKVLDEKKTKYTIQRSKGLGENEPEMMSKTTMNPASRRLIRICEDDAAKTADTFDIMLGENPERRKDYIARHGAEYLYQADI
jgi:DNA gyrase subunit B